MKDSCHHDRTIYFLFSKLSCSKLALYTFKRRHTIVGEKHVDNDVKLTDVPSLDSLLLGLWEERMQRGLFRYDVTICETKVIPGNYGFIAQLNEGRHLKKRPTEFRVDKVLQDFDPCKFNFTKVGQEEVLFRFEESEEGKVQYLEKAPVLDSPNVIAINVSPVEYGHVLLVPRVLDCLPQRIDHDSLLLALHLAVEAGNPSFRLGYNSLGAFASINHLHFQCYAEKQALGEVNQEILDTQVYPGVWEISGHIALKWKQDFDGASEDHAWKLLAEASLSEERFEEVKAYILEAAVTEEVQVEEEEHADIVVEDGVPLYDSSKNTIMPLCT